MRRIAMYHERDLTPAGGNPRLAPVTTEVLAEINKPPQQQAALNRGPKRWPRRTATASSQPSENRSN